MVALTTETLFPMGEEEEERGETILRYPVNGGSKKSVRRFHDVYQITGD